jgi:hypothetical protein
VVCDQSENNVLYLVEPTPGTPSVDKLPYGGLREIHVDIRSIASVVDFLCSVFQLRSIHAYGRYTRLLRNDAMQFAAVGPVNH